MQPTHPRPSPPPQLDDARDGIDLSRLDQRVPLAARVGAEPIVLMLDAAGAPVALSDRCPHAGAPLSQGRVHAGCLMCPWHHAAFALADGRPQAGPTAQPLRRFATRVVGGRVKVSAAAPLPGRRLGGRRQRVVVVGGGAAAHGVLARLGEQRFLGEVVVLSAAPRALYDRTQLSKMALAAGGRAASLPQVDGAGAGGGLRLSLRQGHRVEALHPAERCLSGRAGGHPFRLDYDACVLATGARARRDGLAGGEHPDVLVLRGQADLVKILQRVVAGGRVFLVGGGFIGLEVAGALAARGARPQVLLPALPPLGHLLGEQMGRWLQRLHERHQVGFIGGAKVSQIGRGQLLLAGGQRLATGGDPVIVGLGMQANDELAVAAGLRCREGIWVDGQMATSAAGIWAAGDVALPAGTDVSARGHWSAALWQGAAAADAILQVPPRPQPLPLVWTRHHQRTVVVAGRLGPLRAARVFGDLEGGAAVAGLWTEAGLSAVASVGAAPTSLGCSAALAAGRPDEAERLLRRLGAA